MLHLKKYKHAYIPLILLIIGLIIGYSLKSVLGNYKSFNTTELRLGGYKLINPLYECDIDESFSGSNYGKLENRLVDMIDKSIIGNDAKKISVYFRDLNNGPWFGINEKEKFAPASLLKVPIAIALYKKAEKDPFLLKKTSVYDAKTNEEQALPYFRPAIQLEEGKSYSVENLIEAMISRSDNNAKDLLINKGYVGTKDVEKVLSDLEITLLTDQTFISDYLSVREYSSLFRVLYNASYLSREYSEKLLHLLSEADFSEGLRKPIPNDVIIANKFGERHYENTLESSYQIHDCGIIYFKNHPYFLCVMTEGNNYKSLLDIIQKISKETYKEFENRYKD